MKLDDAEIRARIDEIRKEKGIVVKFKNFMECEKERIRNMKNRWK